MIDSIKRFVLAHPEAAPFAIACSLMLGGCNLPISADMVILIAATLAATLLKGSFIPLYLGVFFGSCLAAYIAYAQGRFLGHYLLKFRFFKKLFPQERLIKIKTYYTKHSWATLIIGRFIPFGFRNALFMSTGLARFPFKKLALADACACLIWSLCIFSSFYHLVLKVDDLLVHMKKFNLIIFSLLALSIIGSVWYKQIKKRRLLTR